MKSQCWLGFGYCFSKSLSIFSSLIIFSNIFSILDQCFVWTKKCYFCLVLVDSVKRVSRWKNAHWIQLQVDWWFPLVDDLSMQLCNRKIQELHWSLMANEVQAISHFGLVDSYRKTESQCLWYIGMVMVHLYKKPAKMEKTIMCTYHSFSKIGGSHKPISWWEPYLFIVGAIQSIDCTSLFLHIPCWKPKSCFLHARLCHLVVEL